MPGPALATVTSSVSGSQLSVSVTGTDTGDSIVVTCQGAQVKVNGADPGTGPALCASITHVSVQGGSAGNIIDLSGFGPSFGAFGFAFVHAGDGPDSVIGSAFGDHVNPGAGNDSVQGRSGLDTLAFDGTAGDDVIVATGSQVANGAVETDTYSEIEQLSLWGAHGADTITGGPGNDQLDGGPGLDQIDGGGGTDRLLWFGSPGADRFDGGNSATSDEPHANVEEFQLNGGGGNDVLIGGPGNDSLSGEADDDLLTGGSGFDFLTGGAGVDVLDGAAQRDTLYGGGEIDDLDGGAGDDFLSGEGGADTLRGNTGADTLEGGPDDDTMLGGDGDDTISVLAGNDDVDGGAGSDWVTATFGALGANVQTHDTGPTTDEDLLSVTDCTGVTVTTGLASRPPEAVHFSGFEEKPCGFELLPTELRGEFSVDIDYVDPALSYYVPAWQILYATCAKLLNYPDEPGPRGGRLVPEVAEGMPTVSGDGRTYTFTIRGGFQFAPAGGPVTADSFKWAFDRLLDRRMSSPAQPFFRDIVGADEMIAGTAPTVSGVVASGNELRITLENPAPDFLARMAMPFTCPLPRSVPVEPDGIAAPVPSAGPYYVDRWTKNRVIVVRQNPEYPGARPHNFETIRIRIGNPLETIKERIETGAADFGDVPPSSHGELGAQYGPGSQAASEGRQRYFVYGAPTVLYLAMNHEQPLFGDDPATEAELDPRGNVPLKKAVNFAIDRTEMLRLRGDHAGVTTDQHLPTSMPGFRDEDIYPATPNLREARRLAGCTDLDDKATCPQRTGVFYCSNRAPAPAQCANVEQQLLEIGLDMEVKLFPRATQFELTGRRGEPFDMTLEGWHMDYYDPFDFLFLLDGRTIRDANNVNFAYFSSPAFSEALDDAKALFGTAREDAFGALDVETARNDVPWAPYAVPNDRYFFSERIGCHTYVPPYGIDLAKLCIRESAHDTVASGGQVTTDDDGQPGATADDAVETTVVTPNPGTVVIREEESGTPAAGYAILGHEVFISAPQASAASPLLIQFWIDGSITPSLANLQVFRNGSVINDCTGAGATPDPCVAERAREGDDAVITIRTSQASRWNFGYVVATPPPPPPPPGPPPGPPPPPAGPPPPPPPSRPPAQARCVVPNVRGKTVPAARLAFARSRCALGRVSRAYSGRVRKSRIISQSRRVGSRHPRGTRVNVVVSRGRRR